MANWSDLKAAVASIVKTNGNNEITGQLLQNVLNNIISNVGMNSTFAGIATPETNPGTPDGNVFYLATTAGTYSNFNGIVINSGEAVILEWKGSWVKKDSGFATKEKLSELEKNTNQRLSELGQKVITINSELYGKGGINDISSLLVWSEGYQILAAGDADLFGTAQQISSGKRDASDYYELGDATSIVTTLIHPESSISNGGLVFYDVDKVAIYGGGHYLNSNTADAYTEVEIAIPSNAKYFRTTRWNTIAGVSGTFKCELRTSNSDNGIGLVGEVENLKNKVSGLQESNDNQSQEIAMLDKAINGEFVYEINDISSLLVWSEGYQILAAGGADLFGTAQQISSGKRDASDYYELGDATSIVTTLIHPASTISNGGLVFYDANKTAIIGEGHYLNSNSVDAYKEVEIAIPSNAKYFRTTRWNASAGVSGEFKCELKTLVGQVSEGIIGRLNKLECLGINPIIGSPKIYQSEATEFGNINDLTVEQVYELYDDLVSLYPNYFFKREDLGTDSSGLHQLRHYTLRMGNPYVSSTYAPNDPSTNIWDDNTMSPRTICIVAGVHGNEKTSIYGVYLSVKEILESNDEWATFIRANFVLEICPIVNCWGVDNNSRPNFNGANINRDFLEESPQAETILVKNLIKECHNLHAVLDSHNSTYVSGVGSVNLGYLPTNNTFRFHNYYCQVAAKLASSLYPRMKELFNRSTQKPYIVAWISNNSGTLMDYVNNELNLIGGTLEAPNCDYGISDATLNNNSKWCEVTKDLLINTIQLYGCQEYSNKTDGR